MTPARFAELTARFREKRVAVVGDVSLDRYLEIDPAHAETSLETGLPVHNIARVRHSPGAAGNIIQNLGALGAREIFPVGFCGDDGEGFELLRALRLVPGANLENFVQTPDRATFTYTKPLLGEPGRAPRELSRFDQKNWSPTPPDVETSLCFALRELAPSLDALVGMDQCSVPGCGVITPAVLATIAALSKQFPRLVILADSRRGLGGFPPLAFKMNAAEFATLTGNRAGIVLEEIKSGAERLARTSGRAVFVTLAERGMVGAAPGAPAEHAPALPVRGPIDIVGAGDAVTAALTLTLAASATLAEAMQLAQAAASVVIHQLGTTGTASPAQLQRLVCES